MRDALTRVDSIISSRCASFFREIGRREPYASLKEKVAFHWLAEHPKRTVVGVHHGLVDGIHRIGFRESLIGDPTLPSFIVHELAHAAGVGGSWVEDDPGLSHARAYQAPVRCGLAPAERVNQHAGIPDATAFEYSVWLGRSVSPQEARRHLLAGDGVAAGLRSVRRASAVRGVGLQ